MENDKSKWSIKEKKKKENKCLFDSCFLKLFSVFKNKENRENTDDTFGS